MVTEVTMKVLGRIAAAAAVFALASAVDAAYIQDPAPAPRTQPPAAGAPQEPGRGGAPGAGPGRGGGRGNPSAALYTERCAGCHGTETAAGRAPNLFDDQWV